MRHGSVSYTHLDVYKRQEVDDAMEGILTQITIGNGSKWHDVYLDVPKDKKQFPEFVTLKERTTDRRYSLDEKEVVLTEKIAKELEVQAGDMITIRDEEKGDLKVKIKAVCENYMGHYLYMTADAYEAVYNEDVYKRQAQRCSVQTDQCIRLFC